MTNRVLIMGAAGRDFHNFNVYFRNNSKYKVVAFTATQIPGIDDKKYPAELAGKELYPDGIPIYSENDLVSIINKEKVELVVFAYSDITHQYVMHKASIVNAMGIDFLLLGTNHTTIETSEEYAIFYSKIHKMLRENQLNPSVELSSEIAKLEDEAYKKFPDYMIKSDEVLSKNILKSTTNKYDWEDSVRATGSFGYATIYWTEPYVGSNFKSYGINRRVDGSSYFYRKKTSNDSSFNSWKDKGVSSNTYYYYYVKLTLTNYYLSTDEIKTYIN